MHPRLLICLTLSILAGFIAAGSAVAAGWSLFWLLPVYSAAGSLTLLASTVLATLAEDAMARFTAKSEDTGAEPAHA